MQRVRVDIIGAKLGARVPEIRSDPPNPILPKSIYTFPKFTKILTPPCNWLNDQGEYELGHVFVRNPEEIFHISSKELKLYNCRTDQWSVIQNFKKTNKTSPFVSTTTCIGENNEVYVLGLKMFSVLTDIPEKNEVLASVSTQLIFDDLLHDRWQPFCQVSKHEFISLAKWRPGFFRFNSKNRTTTVEYELPKSFNFYCATFVYSKKRQTIYCVGAISDITDNKRFLIVYSVKTNSAKVFLLEDIGEIKWPSMYMLKDESHIVVCPGRYSWSRIFFLDIRSRIPEIIQTNVTSFGSFTHKDHLNSSGVEYTAEIMGYKKSRTDLLEQILNQSNIKNIPQDLINEITKWFTTETLHSVQYSNKSRRHWKMCISDLFRTVRDEPIVCKEYSF